MPTPRQIMTSLGDTHAIDVCEVHKVEMSKLFADLSDRMKAWNDKRPSQIMRKMASTVHSVPYDMLAELGYSYNPTLICLAALLNCCGDEFLDCTDANALVKVMLDDLRGVRFDELDEITINRVDALLNSLGLTRT